MKRMLASDYDQTLYLNDVDIENNKQAIYKFMEEGNIFVIATGRSYLDFKKKVNEYNLKYDYVIINHGATILDHKDNILYNCKMDNHIASTIKTHLELEKAERYFFCSELKSRVEYEHLNLTKISVLYNLEEDAIRIDSFIKNNFSSYVNSYLVSNREIEIVAKEVNKSKAIALLSNKINIDANNIYAIGDGHSDIQMIKDYHGYCMKNSVEELKKVALSYKSVSLLIEDILNEKL